MLLKSTLLIFASLIAFSAHAGVIFSNTGSASGWSSNNINSNCSVTTSSSVSYAGSTSMRCEAVFNGNYNGRYHAMKVRTPFGGENDTRWIGFAFRLKSDHTFVSESMWLLQTIANYGGSVGFKPNIWLRVNNRNLELTRQSGPLTSATKNTINILSNLQAGRWYEVVMKIHLDDDSTGNIKVWVDGVLEGTSSGANYFDGVSKTLRVDFGIYCTTWYQKDSLPDPAGSPRVVFFDEIRLGDQNATFDDMDPSQSGGGGTEIIIDNGASGYSEGGSWSTSSASPGYFGSNYRHDGSSGTSSGDWAAWKPTFPSSGSYEVFARWAAASNRPNNIKYKVYHQGSVTEVFKNQQANGGSWQSLGTYTFDAGTSNNNRVTLDAASDAGFTIADAVRFVKQ